MITSRILTVLTPATDHMLVSLDTVKDEFNINDTSLDDRLTRWITQASSAIEGYVGRTLREETVAETVRSGGLGCEAPGEHFYPRWNSNVAAGDPTGLSLRRYPIISVTSVVSDGIALFQDVDFEVDPEYGSLYRLSGSCRIDWWGLITVITYSAGYGTADDVPGDLQAACLALVTLKRGMQGRDPSLRGQTVPGVLEQQFQVGMSPGRSGLPPEIEPILRRYRDIGL